MRVLQNKKGFSIVDSTASLFLVGVLIIILHTFNSYATASNLESDKEMEFYKIVNNNIQQIYSENWSGLIANTVSMNNVTVDIKYSDYQPETEYHTQQIKVTFSYDKYDTEYILEKEIGA